MDVHIGLNMHPISLFTNEEKSRGNALRTPSFVYYRFACMYAPMTGIQIAQTVAMYPIL